MIGQKYWTKGSLIGQSPSCCIPSFVRIGPSVPEKKIFKIFFTIYGHGGHLGHVTWSLFPPQAASHEVFFDLLSGFVVSEVNMLEHCGRQLQRQTTEHGYTIS